MYRAPIRIGFGVVFASFGLAAAGWADCVDGVRNPTAAELEFSRRATAALVAALPAPIVDSARRGAPYDFASQPTLSFCRGDREGSFAVAVAGGYLYTFPNGEAERRYPARKRLEKQVEELEALPPEKDAQYKEMVAKSRAAYDAAPRRQRKDPPFTPDQQAQADRAAAEGRTLQEAASKFLADHRRSVRTQTDALKAQAERLQHLPQEIVVRIRMNVAKFEAAGPLSVTFGTPNAGLSSGLRVHNVVVTVEGPDDLPVKTLFESIDT